MKHAVKHIHFVGIGGAGMSGIAEVLANLAAELVLLDAGWTAINLGPNTPLASFRKALTEFRPRLLWLSVNYLGEPDNGVIVAI